MTIKNILQKGFILESKGYYKKAIEVFYKALELDNSSLELLYEIAKLYYFMHNEEKSLDYVEQILDKNPTHVETLRLLKQIFVDRNAYEQAEQTAKNIYCISQNTKDLIEIFKLLNKQKKYGEIFEYHVENPNAEVYIEKSRALFCQRNFDEAEILVKKALELEPESAEALLLLGKIFYAKGDEESCVEIAKKLKTDESNSELLNFLGLIKSYLNEDAEEYFKKAIKLNRENPQYYYNLANFYLKNKRMSLAKKYYNLAISKEPENQNYHFALANLYYLEKHYKKALEELPNDYFEAKLLRAVILYETGYLAFARKELMDVLEERPQNNVAEEYLQKINSELGLK